MDWVKGGSRGYVTASNMHWDIGLHNSGWVLTISQGTEFESSVPFLLRWFLSRDDPKYLKAALVHDVLLDRGFRPAFADSQWFEVALSEHAPVLKTWTISTLMKLRRFAYWVIRRN